MFSRQIDNQNETEEPYKTTQLKLLITIRRTLQGKYYKHPYKYEIEYSSVGNSLNKQLRNTKEDYYCNKIKRELHNKKNSDVRCVE